MLTTEEIKILEDIARSKEILFSTESVFLDKVKRALNLKDNDIESYIDEDNKKYYIIKGKKIKLDIKIYYKDKEQC